MARLNSSFRRPCLIWVLLATAPFATPAFAQTCSGSYSGDLSGGATLDLSRNVLTLTGAIPQTAFDPPEDSIEIELEFRSSTTINQIARLGFEDLLLAGEVGDCYMSVTYDYFPINDTLPARLTGQITIGELPENTNSNGAAPSNSNSNSDDDDNMSSGACGAASAALFALSFAGLAQTYAYRRARRR